MQTPPMKNQNTNLKQLPSKWPKAPYWIVLFSTILLFITLTISFFVVLAITDDSNSNSNYGVGGDLPSNKNNGGNISTQNNNNDNNNKPSVSGTKTNISLPYATPAGNYISTQSGSVSQIEGITSASAILVDIDGKVSVAEKNADERVYPASMTKVMTLLVACERASNPNALLTVTQAMVDKYENTENEDASIAFTWQVGNQVTVEDALHMVIYKSDTYACWLLAEHIAGSEQAFVAMMNAKAKSIGANSTNFTNCTGLYNDNHYTTCRDMAAIMAAVMNNKTASAIITSTSLYKVDIFEDGQKTDTSYDLWCNWYTARLEKYRWGAAAAYYAGAGSDIKIVAGKTGYETIPKCCFVTSGVNTETGKRYVCVQVGRTSADQPTVSEKASTDDTRIIYQKYALK